MRRRSGTVLIVMGALLLLAALSLSVYNREDAQRANHVSQEVLAKLEDEMTVPILLEEKRPAGGMMPTIWIDGYEYIGTLTIPRFGLELPVMSEWSYEGLKIAPGRYSGSVWNDNLIICGHNYERHFGNLRNLTPGDTVIFTDVLENVFTYEVREIDTLSPTAVQDMIAGNWDLTLFTCTIGGQTRVTVRCSKTEGP